MNANGGETELPGEDAGALLLRKVARAMGMSAEERFRAGGELFEFACESARAGIRATLDTADPEPAVVEGRLRARLELEELLEPKRPR